MGLTVFETFKQEIEKCWTLLHRNKVQICSTELLNFEYCLLYLRKSGHICSDMVWKRRKPFLISKYPRHLTTSEGSTSSSVVLIHLNPSTPLKLDSFESSPPPRADLPTVRYNFQFFITFFFNVRITQKQKHMKCVICNLTK